MLRATISVIVPIYNTEIYLRQCLDSILCQTYANIEIILIDDGSTDNCPEICDEYAQKDHRIKVIHNQNGGQISARKAGVAEATGEYIAFVDSDDWIDIDAFERVLMSVNEANAPDIIAYGCIEEYGEFSKRIANHVNPILYIGDELEQLKNSILMDEMFFEWKMLPHLCDKIIRRDIVERNINFVEDCITFGEDAACVFPCMLEADSILVVDDVPYHYRQREGSAVKSQHELRSDNFIQIYQILRKSFGEREGLLLQLKYYMYFLLLLKSYSQFASKMLLFPFEEIKSDAKIYLYGAGGFGRVLKNYIETCPELQFVGWTDGNATKYREMGISMDTVEKMMVADFDYLVISVLNERIAQEIRENLQARGMVKEKILSVSKERLDEKNLPKWYIKDM